MRIEIHQNKGLNLREHKVSGKLSKEDLFGYLGELYASPDFDANMNILWDLRKADLSSFFLPEVVETRDFVEKSLREPKALKAALVVSSQVDYTLTIMYETLLKGSAVTVKVFFDIAEAKKWAVS